MLGKLLLFIIPAYRIRGGRVDNGRPPVGEPEDLAADGHHRTRGMKGGAPVQGRRPKSSGGEL